MPSETTAIREKFEVVVLICEAIKARKGSEGIVDFYILAENAILSTFASKPEK